ncbi:MAG TPA: DUF2235 domain-containing protein [Vicinamibacterales bacterium]|jgi:hypothetical protein|nr:DUF2235 domain-containing protein [Vicinamibacterales bacterium]
MALYAFDGTWNTRKDDDEKTYANTNVVRFFEAYDRRTKAANPKIDNFYVEGVGTRFDLLGRIAGGAFGLGELSRLEEAYTHLCKCWVENDDHDIDIVGFSRGAATTLDFCHIVLDRGIRKPGTTVVVEPKPTIRFLGVWDIVAAFGLANLGVTDLNIGHHLTLPKANIRFVCHALALDERRPSFLPTRLWGGTEVWFRGAHSDVGGGNGNRGLNDVTLHWMMSKAIAATLPFTQEDLDALQPDPSAKPKPAADLPLDIRLVTDVDRRHYTVAPCTGFRTPPGTCPIETQTDEGRIVEVSVKGIELLPQVFRDRANVLMATAIAQATALDYSLGGAEEAIFGLIEARIPLVTNDADLARARVSTANLVTRVVANAKKRQFNVLNDFFVTEALHDLRPLYPFTDD